MFHCHMLVQPQARVRGSLTDLVFQLGGLELNTFVLFMWRGSGHFVCVAYVSRAGKEEICLQVNRWLVQAKGDFMHMCTHVRSVYINLCIDTIRKMIC